jgi:ferredoxin-nitrite reductase
VLVRPAEATQVADAIVRVFIEHGDRTDRNKARLKYVLDRIGIDAFLAKVDEKLGRSLVRAPPDALAPRPVFDRAGHIGVHAQRQQGLNWIGIVLPVGRLTAAQMRGLARIASEFGDGDLRLTVWQNLLISGVPDARVAPACAQIAALDLSIAATPIRAGLVACTGNRGCRFSASDTKQHAEDIARWCEARVEIDSPVNIHLTGCHHSCAQHYIGDIGLLGARVAVSDDGDTVEGYHVHVGGGFGPHAGLARELYRDVRAEDAPRTVERLLRAYLTHRAGPDETFLAFARRHEVAALRSLCQAEAAE